MIAINCSQCGALIKRVRIRDKIAECEYCHSTTQIFEEKIIYVKENPRREFEKLTEEEKRTYLPSFDWDDEDKIFNEETKTHMMLFAIAAVGTIVLFYFVFSTVD
ncbi:MAG: hypothetical protein R2681_03445 [Pyrinomonadaceae bacterium]